MKKRKGKEANPHICETGTMFCMKSIFFILLGSLIYNKASYFISSSYVLCAKILICKVTEAVK